MKAIMGATLAGLIGIGCLSGLNAQGTFSSGGDNPVSIDSQVTKSIPGGKGPVDSKGRMALRPTGILTALARQGPVMLSPVAPKEYGIGERFVTANPVPPATIPGGFAKGETREFGGLKLFGWDF